jgi:hypothetical protein
MGASIDDVFAQGREGHQWDIPLECEPVRIIRFFPLCSSIGCPIPNNWWRIAELTFWGDDTIPQE